MNLFMIAHDRLDPGLMMLRDSLTLFIKRQSWSYIPSAHSFLCLGYFFFFSWICIE